MKLRNRILIVILALLTVGVSIAVAVSYDAPCGAAQPLPEGTIAMKAIVHRCYGSAHVLRMEEIAKPTPAGDEVLVRVRAAALNPADWYRMSGKPYIVRLPSGFGSPEDTRLGVDFAGTIEAVGENVTRFDVGDEVFGGAYGALAEYVTVRQDRAVALKPSNMAFEQVGAVSVAAVTALQALRDQARIQPGQHVLINGASGGVGTFAVQIAKSMGAEVTGVCSTRNLDLVRSIGADHVIDYTGQDFTQGAEHYDAIIDNVGNHSITAYRRVLKDDGILVIVGGPKDNPWLGPLWHVIKGKLSAPFVSEEIEFFIARLNKDDMEVLRQLMQDGSVTPVIDRRYSFTDVPAAMQYLETGRARGKVVVNLQ